MSTAARRGLAAAGCIALSAAGLTALPVTPAHATVALPQPSEVSVVPAYPTRTDFPVDSLVLAGETGFLHQYGGSSWATSTWLWTRYADGSTRVVTELAGLTAPALAWAGGDRIWVKTDVAGHSDDRSLTIFDAAAGTWSNPTLPTDGTKLAYSAGTMLVRLGTAGPLELRKFAADGTYTTIPITGVPDGTAVSGGSGTVFDSTTFLVSFSGTTDGVKWQRLGLLDFTSGKVSLLPQFTFGTVNQILLSATHLGFRGGNTVRVFSRAAITAGTATDPAVITVPSVPYLTLVGGDMLVRASAADNRAPARLISADGSERTVLPMSQSNPYAMATAPGGALLVGGSGAADWAVQRITADGVQPVMSEVRTNFSAGITISRGQLRHVRAGARPFESPVYDFSNHELIPGLTGLPVTGPTMTGVTSCAADVTCVRTMDGNRYGTGWTSSTETTTTVRFADGASGGFSLVLAGGGGSLVDVSDDYAIVNTTSPAKQYVIPTANPDARTERAVTAAALDYATLWTAGAGQIRSKDLTTGKTAAPISIGAACTPSELQAAGRFVFWSCGVAGPAGVYDVPQRINHPLPAGRYLLGDGYAVRHDAATGRLISYDVTLRGAPKTAILGTLDRGTPADDRNITWAVDKYSGNVAYVDAAGAAHVIDPAVVERPPTVIRSTTSADVVYHDHDRPWVRQYTLSRPVASWRAEIAELHSGKVVMTLNGGASTGEVRLAWDGYLADKTPAPAGRYRVNLVVTTPDGVGHDIAGSPVYLDGERPRLHSYGLDGMPSMLSVDPQGNGAWWHAYADRRSLVYQYISEFWDLGTGNSQISALVPYGDINGDRNNDVLARTGNGVLWAHLGFGEDYFGSDRNRVVKIGTGWNRFDTLITTGDVTGDGITDLLARDARTGKVLRYAGNGTGGFTNGVPLSGSYQGFRLIGPGDVDGDGHADLLLIDGRGGLYAQYGTGTGTFGASTRIGSGFKAYNVVLGIGDLNLDGLNDLLARDASGKLYRFLGTDAGTFGAAERIGSGYQTYAGLF
ncbi:Integrin alpha-V [Actinoplanes sp. SE50]|uniref:FG-GAP-like repeat-containing protein n=1 Tax=unclassified Actinoplanes TaxID=2626549 RepID=UPI00023EBE5B|nr:MULTISPECIES: FG-GAP-like repeat-containing protein [unclassified Actinoplanes]AEV81275.1 Integrin alpha-V [Actinoplanes sp. SE50/110]ATO79678.1 Integrin alpha-V [Actinoplanes sp. SE50]SLL97081.1 integrin alpha-V [Actinoplanes sp. SE50/110]